ncbi:phospholipase D family protein [Kineococcus arenarius]|uniref:phospholipase D family protein n=1 Tax=Kineococcus sp. SYSU DK007 TaxID=3383128 RepID=UPI003D7EB542
MPRKKPRIEPDDDLFRLGGQAGTGFVFQRLASQDWPEATRFPVNHAGSKVAAVVSADLEGTDDALIVTGFASIAEVIDLIAHREQRSTARQQEDGGGHGAGAGAVGEKGDRGRDQVRLLLGSEPFAGQRRSLGSPQAQFAQEVSSYWLERHGISLHLSAKIIQAQQALQDGRLQVRFVAGSTALHAKIYAADDAVTLGSGNFTHNGLRAQIEANVRFQRATAAPPAAGDAHEQSRQTAGPDGAVEGG